MARKRRGDGGFEASLKDVRKFVMSSDAERFLRAPLLTARMILTLSYQGSPLLRLFRNILSDEAALLRSGDGPLFKVGDMPYFAADVTDLEPMPLTVWGWGYDMSVATATICYDLGQIELPEDYVKDLALESYLHDLTHYGFYPFGHDHIFPNVEIKQRHLELVKE